VVTVSWDSTNDGNASIESVTFQLDNFGGSTVIVTSSSSGVFSTTYTIPEENLSASNLIDSSGLKASMSAKNLAGTSVLTDSSTLVSIDNARPRLTDTNIKLFDHGSNDLNPVFSIPDWVIVEWDNSNTGDGATAFNNDIVSVAVDFTEFGSTTQVAAEITTNNTWRILLPISSLHCAEFATSPCGYFQINAGNIDSSNLNVSVTVTDDAGNSTTIKDKENVAVDNIDPVATDNHVTINQGSGPAGTFIPGDVVTMTWDNTATGDNNTDIISHVRVGFSEFGGPKLASTSIDQGVAAQALMDTWTASYTITEGSEAVPAGDEGSIINASNLNIEINVWDDGGNVAIVTDSTNSTVNNSPPSITSATYDAGSGKLTVLGTNLIADPGAADIDVHMLTLSGAGGALEAYPLDKSSDIEIGASGPTGFTVTLHATDKEAVNLILNRDGIRSGDAMLYNLSAAAGFLTAVPAALDLTSTITVSNVTFDGCSTNPCANDQTCTSLTGGNVSCTNPITAAQCKVDDDCSVDEVCMFTTLGGGQCTAPSGAVTTSKLVFQKGFPDLVTAGTPYTIDVAAINAAGTVNVEQQGTITLSSFPSLEGTTSASVVEGVSRFSVSFPSKGSRKVTAKTGAFAASVQVEVVGKQCPAGVGITGDTCDQCETGFRRVLDQDSNFLSCELDVPAAPTNVTATDASISATPTTDAISAIGLTWTPPDEGNSEILSWRVKVTQLGGNSVVFDVPKSNLSRNFTDLAPGMAYSFQVAGLSAVGLGKYSSPVEATTKLGDVDSLGINADTTHNSAKLSWDAVEGATHYTVRYLEEQSLQVDTPTATLSLPEPNTAYSIRIRAEKALTSDRLIVGEFTSYELTTKPTPPAVTSFILSGPFPFQIPGEAIITLTFESSVSAFPSPQNASILGLDVGTVKLILLNKKYPLNATSENILVASIPINDSDDYTDVTGLVGNLLPKLNENLYEALGLSKADLSTSPVLTGSIPTKLEPISVVMSYGQGTLTYNVTFTAELQPGSSAKLQLSDRTEVPLSGEGKVLRGTLNFDKEVHVLSQPRDIVKVLQGDNTLTGAGGMEADLTAPLNLTLAADQPKASIFLTLPSNVPIGEMLRFEVQASMTGGFPFDSMGQLLAVVSASITSADTNLPAVDDEGNPAVFQEDNGVFSFTIPSSFAGQLFDITYTYSDPFDNLTTTKHSFVVLSRFADLPASIVASLCSDLTACAASNIPVLIQLPSQEFL
jgi:hypothetical protein